MRRQINNFLSICYSFIKFIFLKIFHWNFKFYMIERFSPNVVVEIRKNGKLCLGKKVRVHSGSKIKVNANSKCYIGNNVKINYNCMIVCQKNISIGDNTEFGPSVYLFDHDHLFTKEDGVKANDFSCDDIIIGKNVWIGAGTIILKGTIIGDNCIIGAGCIIKGNYPSGSKIIQKRITSLR